MEGPFYVPPGQKFEPGDIFSDIPFPALKYPLEWFRASPNPKNKGGASIFAAADGHVPQSGDTARGAFTKRTVVLLSWECEIDAVFRDQAKFGISVDRRYWLAAPVKPVSELKEKMKARTAEGRQPNKFLLPPSTAESEGPFGDAPQFIDLRQITPITVSYFVDAQEQGRKIGSLSRPAILAMQAHLGMFFSGLVIYVQPISCPKCNENIDPTMFVVDSVVDEPDVI
jgi:hypothetical protein